MTGPVTYGELLDDAATALSGLHTLANVGFRDPADAIDTAAAWRRLLATGIRHAGLLAPADPRVAALPRLRPARRPAWTPAGAERCGHPAGAALARAGEELGLAHDVLASHLGPDRQRRTPDAALIEAAGACSPAMRALSSLLLTTAVAHQALAARTLDLEPQPARGRVPAPVARILAEGVAVLGPAARLYDGARAAAAHGGDPLGRLTTATSLTAPDPRSGPAGQLAGALARLRVAAHRQGHGDLPAGAATMRALTTVAICLIRRDLTQAWRGRRPCAPRSAFDAADRSWVRLHTAWGEVATLDPGSRGVLYDASTALRLLSDDNPTAQWGMSVDGVPAAADWVPTVAVSLAAVTNRLSHDRAILVPTRWWEDADIPRPWTPAWPEHLDRLAALHRSVLRDSARLPVRAPWSPTRAAPTQVAAAHSGLARTS